MFDKFQQRARAQEFELMMLAKGVKPPEPKPVPVTKPALAAWPYHIENKPTTGHTTQPITATQHLLKQKKEPKMAVTYLVEPFTNDLGQTIQPGDPVICVKQGYNHTIKISKGTYLGLRRDSRGVRNVVVHYTELKNGYQLNGKAASYKTPGASYGKYSHTGKTSLPSKRIYPTL
jgi:hypothetical protein